MAGVKRMSSNKATLRGEEAGIWQRWVMGLAGSPLLMWFIPIAGIAIGFTLIAYSVVAEFGPFGTPRTVVAVLGAIFVFGGLMIKIFSFAVLAGIWQRVLMGLAGSLLLTGGILFDTVWENTPVWWGGYWEGWQGFSGWSAVLIIAGVGYGIATVVPLKGVLRRLLVATGIPVFLLSAIGLSAFLFVVGVCACD